MEVARVVSLSIEGIDATTVLDVGTGTGVFAEAFARKGLAVTGVDANPEFLAVARAHLPTAEFREGTAENLPFLDGQFDIVFLGHVLHEADDALGALGEARRVAKKRVMVLEWPYLETTEGPPLAHRLMPEVVLALAKEARMSGIERISLSHMDLYRMEP